MRTSFIRHVAFEDLGAWDALLRARGPVDMIETGIDDFSAHDPLAADLLIVLGGPIGVYETSVYPWLKHEIAFVAKRIVANKPTFGICLGAQIMAAALGARIYPAGVKEIGFLPIALSEAGRKSCLAPFADDPLVMHWHGDTFDLPAGADLLASTQRVAHQAFSLGPKIVGVQFHPEADLAAFERWLIGHAVELAAAGADIPAMREQARRLAPDLSEKAERVLAAFLEQAEL